MGKTRATAPSEEGLGIYEIRLAGHLDGSWADWFDGLAITRVENGDTLLTGPVVDQAALHGLLKKVRDVGLPLRSLNCLESNRAPHAGSRGEAILFTERFQQKGEFQMNTRINELSPSVYARIAGVLYLIITVAAIFAHFVVPDQLIVPGDAAATAANIINSESLFRIGAVGGELIILLSEIVLSVVLYVLLKPVGKTLSLIAAVSRLAMTIIHGLNLLNYYFVLQLLKGGDYLAVFGQEQVHALVTLFLDAHSIGFTIGVAFLVPHVLILGYLIYKSGYFPRVLGILFIAAGVGYLFDTTGLLLVPGYTTTPGLIATVIAIAEIAFPIWLLFKGVNLDRWQNRTLALETA